MWLRRLAWIEGAEPRNLPDLTGALECKDKRGNNGGEKMKRKHLIAWLWMVSGAGLSYAGAPGNCVKVSFGGEARAGQEWRQALGAGWVFRVLPIKGAGEDASGWDLVVDREVGAGFPDALLLATPPYRSVDEHEVATTFGLRAQDAVGWNPRDFHFLTTAEGLREGQRLFALLAQSGAPTVAGQDRKRDLAMKRLAEISRESAAGEFRILEARLTPGIGDAAPYAESWALASHNTPQTVEPPARGKASARGELHWMRFGVTLWLPEGWKTPPGVAGTRAACPD